MNEQHIKGGEGEGAGGRGGQWVVSASLDMNVVVYPPEQVGQILYCVLFIVLFNMI